MAIDKKVNTQLLLTLPKTLKNQLDEYQIRHKFPSRTAAILYLINKGLGNKKEAAK